MERNAKTQIPEQEAPAIISLFDKMAAAMPKPGNKTCAYSDTFQEMTDLSESASIPLATAHTSSRNDCHLH